MATAVSFRRGTAQEHNDFTGGAAGELTVDTDNRTVWVHLGNSQTGTPLARADLKNVDVENAANLGLAKTDLTNISISEPELIKTKLKPLNYADASGNNLQTSNLASSSRDTAVYGDPLAYANLSNVSVNTIIAKGIPNNNLDGVTTETIVDKLTDTNNQHLYADRDLSNTNTNTLAQGTNKRANGTGLAYYDLSNVSNISNDTKTALHSQGIQLTENISQNITTDVDKYPSNNAVKNAIASLKVLPTLPISEEVPTLFLAGVYRYKYTATLSAGGTNYQVNDLLQVAGLSIKVTAVNSGAITGFELTILYGTKSITKTDEAASGGHGSGAKFNITSDTSSKWSGNDVIWDKTLSSSNIGFDNNNGSSKYIKEISSIGTINNTADALETLGLNQQTLFQPNVTDLSLTDTTGVINVTFSQKPSAVIIKSLIGGTQVPGTWSSLSTSMTFTPTSAADTLENSWIIKATK